MNTKKLSAKFFLILLISSLKSHLLFSYPGIHKIEHEKRSGVELGKRHMMIFTSDNQTLFGVSYFAVFNESKDYQKFRFPVLLPKGTQEFEPREGVEKADFVLGEEGLLFIEKSFKPGVTLVGVDFKIPYSPSERGFLQIEIPFDLEELSLATLISSGLNVQAQGFQEGVPDMLGEGEYLGVIKKNIKKGSAVSFFVEGLPESHFLSQMIGVLLGAAALLGLMIRFYSLGKV